MADKTNSKVTRSTEFSDITFASDSDAKSC